LISACLLGDPVRYDGKSKPIIHDGLHRLQAAGHVVVFCPEVSGGLPVPRVAAEIVGGNGDDVIDGHARVLTECGSDVSASFLSGAHQALALCLDNGIEIAVLTERSPSCGSSEIYDGSFSRSIQSSSGVTTAWLRRHGIRVFNQHQLDAALHCLAQASQERDL
jgi:uncharacterized protein YbbK (DUF523 family)